VRAIRIDHFGHEDVMHLEEVPVPSPKADELLIKVSAAGVNPVDYKIREGQYPAVREDALPLTLGREVAGTVAEVGSAVTAFKPGDEVFAMIGADGGYAEYARVKATNADRIPDQIDAVTAAAIPLAALTAWQALFDHGDLQANQCVLIHGGSGGVGHFAIQLAKATGAEVYATGSKASLAFMKQLGADHVIDHKAGPFEDECPPLDLVIDLIGGETQKRSWAVLRGGGRLVSTLQAPDETLPEAQGKHGRRFTVRPDGKQLHEVAALIVAGQVKPYVHRTFDLENAVDALHYLATEHVEGKIVLKVV